MKKLTAILLTVLIVSVCALPVMAAGVDDGVLSVATKEGEKYFGTQIGSNVTKYVAANGNGSYFYDLTGDKDMNICDLVALTNDKVDIDQSGEYDSEDNAILRLMLIGGAN